jgi:hypothetical protein
MLSSPIVIHVLRPYANEDEYLAHERATIDGKSMLLIDQPALPVETAIVFDVQLTNGQKPIRAEAKVLGYVAPAAGQPGGLRVRFKRFGALTKAFIDRAVNGGNSAEAASLPAPSLASAAMPSLAPEMRSSLAPVEPSLPAPAAPPESAPVASVAHDENETSGVHRKLVSPVAAPANRDALLAKLRGRKAG